MPIIEKAANSWNERNGETYSFYCPGCKHRHIFITKRVTDTGPVWDFNGDMEKPTFAPSLLNRSGPYPKGVENRVCHLFVREGKIVFLSDCTHDLAGQTVSMEDL